MENSEGVYKAIDLVGTGYTAVFEDDGKTAYGYLLLNGKIIADVWLYNCIAAPERPEWPDTSKAPWLNPREFVHDIQYQRIADEDEINFEWYRNKETRGSRSRNLPSGRTLCSVAARQQTGPVAIRKERRAGGIAAGAIVL